MKFFSYIVANFNVVILSKELIKIKDSMAKTIGVATAALYTVYGSYFIVKLFSAFTIGILSLIILVALIVLLWILLLMPMAAAGTVFFLAVSVLVTIIAIWTQEILSVSSRKVPTLCFDKNTLIETNKGKIKIKNLKPGDILANGDKITAVFKLAYENLDMYKLNGITVTGCHKVLHCNLGWIDVKDHPLAKK